MRLYFLKDLGSIVKSLGASSVSHALQFFGLIAVARVAGPEVLGGLFVFTSISNALSAVLFGSMPLLILTSRTNFRATRYVLLNIQISTTLSVLATLCAVVVLPPSITYMALTAVVAGSAALLSGHIAQCVREKNESAAGIASIRQAASVALARVSIALVSPVTQAVVGATAVASLAASVFVPVLLGAKRVGVGWAKVKRRLWLTRFGRKSVCEQFSFMAHQATHQAANTVGIALFVALFANCFDLRSTGVLSISMLVSGLPAQVAGKVVGDRFLREYSGMIGSEPSEARRYLIASTIELFVAGGVAMTAAIGTFFLVGPAIFGVPWVDAQNTLLPLAFWQMLVFANPPSIRSLIARGVNRPLAILNGVTMALRILSVVLGSQLTSADNTVMIFSLVGVVHNLVVFRLSCGERGGHR